MLHNMKTIVGIIIGVVLTLSILMALTVWNAHRKITQIDVYIGTAIQKGIFPTEEALKVYKPASKTEAK